jgi:hypothetical protein
MYANLKAGLEVNGLSSLLLAPLELRYTAPVLMNNYRSPLVLYGTKPKPVRSERPIVKKLMGPLSGPGKRTSVIPVRSERPTVISQRAIIDSGADLHIWNLQDAMKLFSDLQISKLDVIGVNGKTTRADRQGSLVVVLNGPEGNEYNLDLGTAHAIMLLSHVPSIC